MEGPLFLEKCDQAVNYSSLYVIVPTGYNEPVISCITRVFVSFSRDQTAKLLFLTDYFLALLIARLHHGCLTNADGNGDWVLTIFTAMSMVSHLLPGLGTCFQFLSHVYEASM